jgi:uncharacterized protein (DUF1330 family)
MRPFRRVYWVGTILIIAGILAAAASGRLLAQQANAPAFVIVERLSTTGPESIQEQYGKASRDIVAKFGGRYLARSQHNTLLEGDGTAPCCIAVLSFPVRRQPRTGSIRRKIRMPQRFAAAEQRFASFRCQGCLDPDLTFAGERCP